MIAADRLSHWKKARNILCIRLDSLGDVLMTTPAFRALKEEYPDRRITLLTSPSGAEAAALIPEVEETIIYEAPWMKSSPARMDPKADFRMAELLKGKGFDAVVIFSVFSQNPLPAAFLCYLAEIPLRLAYCRENPYHLLTDWVREAQFEMDNRHEVRRQLDLVQAIGSQTLDERLSIQVPPAASTEVDILLDEVGVDRSRSWAVLHTGATAPSRRYGSSAFAEVARCLVTDHDMQVIFTGTEPEREEIDSIRRLMGKESISLAGCLDLGQFAALLEKAPLLISNNSGPIHLAAAVGTPVIDLYALTNPQHTPWKVPSRVLNHDVPCKYCYSSICPAGHHNCLRLVEPAAVVQAAMELLSEMADRKTTSVVIS